MEVSKEQKKDIRLKQGEKAARIATISMIILASLKGVVALISGSMALLADAINSFTDIFASFAVWVGLRLSRRKPTDMFPYGYYRAETFAMLAVSVIIVISGIEIVKEGVKRYAEQVTLSYPILPLVTSLISALTYYFLSIYKRKVGERINSQSLISDSKNSMVDVYSSILVFASIFFTYSGFTWADPIAGIIVGIYVVKTGLWFGKDAIFALMDVCTNPERIDEIKRIAEGIKGVKGVHDVKLRRSGLVVFGEMHLEVDRGLAVIRAHKIADEIEEKVKRKFGDVESLTIHIEPVERKAIKVAIPLAEAKGIESNIETHFGKAPYFLIANIEEDKIKEARVVKNLALDLSKGKGVKIAIFLAEQGIDAILVKSIDSASFHIFKDKLIKIYSVPKGFNVRQALKMLISNKLKLLKEPTREEL